MSFSIFKFSTIQRSTLPPVDLYEKDGKAQLGNLPSSKFPVSPPVTVVSFPTPLRFLFISLSLPVPSSRLLRVSQFQHTDLFVYSSVDEQRTFTFW